MIERPSVRAAPSKMAEAGPAQDRATAEVERAAREKPIAWSFADDVNPSGGGRRRCAAWAWLVTAEAGC